MILVPRKIKSVTDSTFFPSICYKVQGQNAMIFTSSELRLNFKPAFSLSSLTLIKRIFSAVSSSSLSANRMISSAYLRHLIFLPAIFIPACDSSSLAFHIMYSVYRASLVAQLVENQPAMQKTWVQSLGWEDVLEKEEATYSSILA